jgi:hypothetical protein
MAGAARQRGQNSIPQRGKSPNGPEKSRTGQAVGDRQAALSRTAI